MELLNQWHDDEFTYRFLSVGGEVYLLFKRHRASGLEVCLVLKKVN